MSPLYEFRCPCGKQEEVYECIQRYDKISINCKECGHPMTKIISQTSKPIVIEGYSEMADAHFTGPAQKRRVLKEKNLEEAG